MPRIRIALVAAAALAAGCFDPEIEQGFSCADSRLCPPGQICDPVDQRCRLPDGQLDSGVAELPDRCSDSAIIACLTMDGDTADRSAQKAATTAEAIEFSAGVDGQAAVFGAGSAIAVVDYIARTPGPETIELWVRAEASGRVLETPLFVLDLEGTELKMSLEGATLGFTLPTGRFVHLAIALGEQTELFVDGDRQASIGFSFGGAAAPDLVLGDTASSFAGRIDELRVWNRRLTAAEVAAIATGN